MDRRAILDMTSAPLFDVEHALVMYASSFVQLPAAAIYDVKVLARYAAVAKRCHIYMIGTLPKVELEEARQEGSKLIVGLTVAGQPHDLVMPLEDGFSLRHEGEIWYLENEAGERVEPSVSAMMMQLHRTTELLNFNIQYIGQAFGQAGERHALDRLVKHEKLQEIAVKGVGPHHQLNLLLIEVAPKTRMTTVLAPNAKKQDATGKRMAAGLDKLFGTTERVSLYEAAMIRYFQPKLNKEFKDSFPSTNLKVLQDCYAKDFAAVVAEFSIDPIPYFLCSDAIARRPDHIAKHDLRSQTDRKAFFSIT